MADSPGKRLALFRKSLGMNQRAFAVALGFSPSRIGTIESGSAEPSRSFLQRISERYDVSADWLLHGQGPQHHSPEKGFTGRIKRIEPPDTTKPNYGDFRYEGEEFKMIPKMDLSVSAGNGLIPASDGYQDAKAFSTSWLSRNQINGDLAVLVKVEGDSMMPLIPDGSLVLVNSGEKAVLQKGIFAFNRDGVSFVKRLEPVGIREDGRPVALLIIAENPAYPPETLSGSQMNEIHVVGRVRCVMTSY